ncbi:FAD-binding oxidoreductase [Pseudomonas guariconensis]|uniref:NAD(P)/FAD-dependent oxidoreductase n=1 Tax=Pseudomonas guariconensis TaxID=1288410 RepID=UPI0036F2CAB4
MRTVIVLGAGIVGVCTALQLRRRGWDVTLVDRRSPGQETSYGNAGIIQREAVMPYPFPRDLATLLKVLRKGGVDVNYHANAIPALLPRLVRYWQASSPRCYALYAQSFRSLIEHCIEEHRDLIEHAQAGHLIHTEGWLQAYRTPSLFAEAVDRATWLHSNFGVLSQILDSDALHEKESGLQTEMAGAVHWTQSWSVRDPGMLVEAYARLLQTWGARIILGDAQTLARTNTGWSVHTKEGQIDASEVVIALGPWAQTATRALGYRLPLFIKRGYHQHYSNAQALSTPLLDSENGIMMAPMSMGLRITTGAEFARHDAPATPIQLVKAERIARSMVNLGSRVEASPWLGARPCTTDMNPIIGRAPRHKGLWFHFGHAHQGFTLGPASARLLAELMTGELPFVDPRPFDPDRFKYA